MDLDTLDCVLAALHRDRRWILAVDIAAAATEFAGKLREWGADEVMVVAATEGVGDLPDGVPIHYTRSRGATVMEGIRAFERAVTAPSDGLCADVERFDPDRTARVIAPPTGDVTDICGRRTVGARPAAWAALEDKTVADELWDAAGIERAPSAVVPLADAADAARDLATELGSVWVADNADGWHGGAEYTRWVRDPAAFEAARDWFDGRAQLVRVMPFLEGIPCSIHGFIAGDGVATFRPYEMVVFRSMERSEFVYGGGASFWEPPPDLVADMREVARAAGAVLRDRADYRGAFGIDGVCTSAGFRPTELNPRLSVGLAVQAAAASLPIGSVNRLLIEGRLTADAAWIEEQVLEAGHTRRGGMTLPVAERIEPASLRICFVDDGVRVAGADEPADATLDAGSAPVGSVVLLRLDPERTPPGPSIAPKAALAARYAAESWGFALPRLDVAPDVCA